MTNDVKKPSLNGLDPAQVFPQSSPVSPIAFVHLGPIIFMGIAQSLFPFFSVENLVGSNPVLL